MSELDDDIARGCLKNGEPVEAKWGSGWWSGSPFSEREEPEIAQCPKCNGAAYDLAPNGIDCENCGKLTPEELLPYYMGEKKPEANHDNS